MTKAVALQYIRSAPAPFIVAKGGADLAERLVETAHRCGITVKPVPELAEELFSLDVGSYVPPRVYIVVAELLAYVYSIQAAP